MQGLTTVAIHNPSKGTVLGGHIMVANTGLRRLIGLLGKRKLPPGSGLHIIPSSGVHTFGMRFPIDIVALDRNMRVRGTWENVGGFRLVAIHWKTYSVLELPVGAIQASRTEANDQLTLVPY